MSTKPTSAPEDEQHASSQEAWRCSMPDNEIDHDLLALFALERNSKRGTLRFFGYRTSIIDRKTKQTINEILCHNADGGGYTIWSADDYGILPDYHGEAEEGTRDPIDPNWRSPFIGKTIPDANDFMKSAPKPPKPLNTRFCAFVTAEELAKGFVLICKNLENDDYTDNDDFTESDEKTNNGAEIESIKLSDSGEVDEEPDPEPGSFADMMQRADEMHPMKYLDGSEYSLKQRLQRLGNDFDSVQGIPTPKYEVNLFHHGFQRWKWPEKYVAWRESNILI